MKNKTILIVSALAAFCVIGCSSTPKTKDVPYNFAQYENANTASILFSGRIRFVDFEGRQLPEPEANARWNPVSFPAGTELAFRVYVLYRADQPGYRRRGVINLPPLEAGKKYKLWYEPAERNYYNGAGRIILTYDNVTALNYDRGFLGLGEKKPKYLQLYVQEIPPL